MYVLCRYFAAVVLIVYGFAKLTGAQFTVLDSELDKPMGQVSGFWLTWHYFSFSPVFGAAVAMLQIALGTLLFWRRTTLLGAGGGFGVLSLITFIDLAYGIDIGGTVTAVLATAALGYVLIRHRHDLVRLLWTEQNTVRPPHARPRLAVSMKVAALAVLMTGAAGSTYWIANENNRAPTPLDGSWRVVTGSYRDSDAPAPLDRVYFERNRAHMVVFRSGDQWSQHHFEVDPETHTLRMWRQWLHKGGVLFSGNYELTADSLRIVGHFDEAPEPVRLELHRLSTRGT